MSIRCLLATAAVLTLVGMGPALSHEESSPVPPTLRIATFNVSMEADNYLPRGEKGDQQVLIERLGQGDETQIQNVAEIIQRTRPDILFLTEFDYIADPAKGVEAFIKNYLEVGQGGQQPISYQHYYYAPVNTGQPSGYDLDRDGEATDTGGDAWGFGKYPGQYGMLVLSAYPIDRQATRTFQHFKWRDMPDHLQTTTADGEAWYSEDAWAEFRLSSKSHWDVTIDVNGQPIHLLASHPTPPVFDGPENRNGIRNHDEVRFWRDYIEGASYFYDDQGRQGGLSLDTPFVIVGDLNASPVEGDGLRDSISQLLASPLLQGDVTPRSRGGEAHSDSPHSASHTASWGMRADYVLASTAGFEVSNSGVFWPAENEAGRQLVANRGASSDHRLVWLDLALKKSPSNN